MDMSYKAIFWGCFVEYVSRVLADARCDFALWEACISISCLSRKI